MEPKDRRVTLSRALCETPHSSTLRRRSFRFGDFLPPGQERHQVHELLLRDPPLARLGAISPEPARSRGFLAASKNRFGLTELKGFDSKSRTAPGTRINTFVGRLLGSAQTGLK